MNMDTKRYEQILESVDFSFVVSSTENEFTVKLVNISKEDKPYIEYVVKLPEGQLPQKEDQFNQTVVEAVTIGLEFIDVEAYVKWWMDYKPVTALQMVMLEEKYTNSLEKLEWLSTLVDTKEARELNAYIERH